MLLGVVIDVVCSSSWVECCCRTSGWLLSKQTISLSRQQQRFWLWLSTSTLCCVRMIQYTNARSSTHGLRLTHLARLHLLPTAVVCGSATQPLMRFT